MGVAMAIVSAGAALLAGCGVPGLPAKATVTMIDRKCQIVETIKREVPDPRSHDSRYGRMGGILTA